MRCAQSERAAPGRNQLIAQRLLVDVAVVEARGGGDPRHDERRFHLAGQPGLDIGDLGYAETTDPEIPAALEASVIDAAGGNAYAVEADVADKGDCQRIFDTAMTTSGRVDGMVYSVATNPPVNFDSNSMTVENFNYGINVNMLGCYHCNLFAAQRMERNPGDTAGSIVNISSIASVKNELGLNIGIMPYALGKCGLNHITELAAVQFAEAGIRVKTLMLGPINSVLANRDSQSLFGLDADEATERHNDVVRLKMGRASVWESAYAAPLPARRRIPVHDRTTDPPGRWRHSGSVTPLTERGVNRAAVVRG